MEKPTPSTFFPDSWSEEKVLKSINEAYYKKQKIGPSKNPYNDEYKATVNGIEIIMFIDQTTNKIISAFPFMN